MSSCATARQHGDHQCTQLGNTRVSASQPYAQHGSLACHKARELALEHGGREAPCLVILVASAGHRSRQAPHALLGGGTGGLRVGRKGTPTSGGRVKGHVGIAQAATSKWCAGARPCAHVGSGPAHLIQLRLAISVGFVTVRLLIRRKGWRGKVTRKQLCRRGVPIERFVERLVS